MPGIDSYTPTQVGVNEGSTATILNNGNVSIFYQLAKPGGSTISSTNNDGTITASATTNFTVSVWLLGSAPGAQADINVAASGGSSAPTGPAGGSLTGSYPNPGLSSQVANVSSPATITAPWAFSIPLAGAASANYRGADHGPFLAAQMTQFGNMTGAPWTGQGTPNMAFVPFTFMEWWGRTYPGYPVGQTTQTMYVEARYSGPTINDSAQANGSQALMFTMGGVNYTQAKAVCANESDVIIQTGVTTTSALVGHSSTTFVQSGAIATDRQVNYAVYGPPASTAVLQGQTVGFWAQYPANLLESTVENLWGLYSQTRIQTEDTLWVGTFGTPGNLASACLAGATSLTLLPGTISNMGMVGNSSQHIVIGWGHQGTGANSPQATVHTVTGITNNGGCVVPSGLVLTPSATGGSLAPGLYYYRVTATNGAGESLPSLEIMCAIPPGSANAGSIGLAWIAVPGATGYNIYGRTQAGELLIASSGTTSYTDTGSLTPSGALPVSNTTGANDVITIGNTAALLAHAANTTIQITTAGNLYFAAGALKTDFTFATTNLQITTAGLTFSAVNGGATVRIPYQTTTPGTPPAGNTLLYPGNNAGQWSWMGPDGVSHLVSSTPLAEIYMTGLGYQSWSGEPDATSGTLTPTAAATPTGTVYARLIPFRAGMVITKAVLRPATAGAGTAPAHIYVGYADTTGKMLAQSNDLAASAIWTTANVPAQAPLAASWTVPADGNYNVVFVQVGVWGTTQMTLVRDVSGSDPGDIAQNPFSGQTLQTGLPANGSSLTLSTANGSPLWVGAV